jgi:LysM repeat protein
MGYSMNKEDPYRDQAEKLRQNIERKEFEEGQLVQREELPPRSRLHHQKHKKNKWKLKYPVIRLLALFFILLPITIFSIYSAIARDKVGNILKTDEESTEGFETINIEKYDNNPINEEIQVGEENPETPETKDNVGENSNSSVNESGDKNGEAEVKSLTENVESTSRDLVVENKAKESVSPDIVYHTVQPGETIYKISIKYYQSKAGIDPIKTANNLSSNEIRVGQVLTIPLSK